MTTKSKSRPSRSISPTEISSLVCAYGITRDQARRLVNRIGKNRAKLSEAARILKARLPSRSASEAKHPWKSPRSSTSIIYEPEPSVEWAIYRALSSSAIRLPRRGSR